MKVLDIITETTPAPASTPLPEADVIANWLKNNPHLEVKEKYDPAAKNFFTKWISKNQHLNAEILEGFSKRYGLAFTFFKATGIIIPMVQCVLALRALEEQAKEKDANGAYVHDITWVKQQENAILGMFIGSFLVTAIINSIAGGTFISSFSQLLSASAMRAPGGARGIIIAMIAKEAGLIALRVWLNSPEGRAWATQNIVVAMIVGGIGALGNTALEYIRKKIKEYTGKDIGIVTPTVNDRKDKEKETEKSKWTADEIARHEEEIRQRANRNNAHPTFK